MEMQELSHQWLVDNLNAKSDQAQVLLNKLNGLQVWNVKGLIALGEENEVAFLETKGIALGHASAIKKYARQAQSSQQGNLNRTLVRDLQKSKSGFK